jgi:uncharacterized protein YfaS (alpha-2-macroglobulin family)
MAPKTKDFLRRYRYILITTAVLLVAVGGFLIWRAMRPSESRGQPLQYQAESTIQEGGTTEMAGEISQLSIRLSEGQAQPQAAAPLPVASGEPLTEAEIQQILARLPGLVGGSEAQVEFKLPPETLPPPLTGETIELAFPPPVGPDGPGVVESGPLKVLRYAPEGEIPIAPFINITFNQPMVPLATLGELAAKDVPARLEPSLPGTWRWVGTRTLNFQYDSALIDRLPKATVYKVSIPAGTASATGGVLAETIEWTFSTPPPKVLFTYPSDNPQPLDPLFFISFDQRVDPAAVLKTIGVAADDRQVNVELVSATQIRADEGTIWLLENAVEGRWVAFRAKEPLPADAMVSVAIGPGTPSAEGPLVTQEVTSYSFHTYAPLRIEEHGCAWGDRECPPLTPFYIRFNNPIDARLYADSLLRIEPELPGASVNIYGDTIQIQGVTTGRTTYTVIVDGDIQDIFGQKLGADARLTFRVGKAEPALYGPDTNFVTLDPAAKKPVFSVYSMNYPTLELKIYTVQPSDWPAFKNYMRQFQWENDPAQPPGRLVMERTLRLEAPADSLSEVDIPIYEVMDGEFGQFVVIVEPPRSMVKEQDRRWKTVQAWVQVTQIGLDAHTDHSEMVLWATNLQDGAPLSGVEIRAGESGTAVVTAQDGTARFAIPEGATYLVASQGADHALLPRSSAFWGDEVWTVMPVSDELRWYVIDDRQMYRPGEEVHIKGWLRRIGGKQGGDVGLVGDAVNAVSYQLSDSQGNILGNGRVEVNSLGGFDFVFSLPQGANLGYAHILLTAEGSLTGLGGVQSDHSIQIQEFRRPEFEVTARNETAGPYFAGEYAVLAVEAKYYAGGALPNADVAWEVTSSPGNYAPPNWPDFTFGVWTPWWWGAEVFGPWGGEDAGVVETFDGKTDPSGTHYLRLDFSLAGEPRPVSIQAQATVMDVNRQAWTGSTSLLVHPANLYVGLRSSSIFVERGTPLKVDFIVTNLDGNPVADRLVEVRAARLEWKFNNGAWGEEETDVQKCSLGSKLEPVTCTFETPLGGSYRITATVTDDLGRNNQSQFTRWVSGGKLPPARKVEQEDVTLIPDKERYQPGDVAQILVQSPFSPAEGLLTVSRNGILSTERFHIEDGTVTLSVPIEDGHVPNLNLQVDVTGAAARSDDQGQALTEAPPRPAYASGQLVLRVPPLQRTLALQATLAESELAPGGETTLDLVLKDARGQPVAGAELAVVVVDEAILALSNYQLLDPLAIFYSDRPSYLTSIYSRSNIVLANPQTLAASDGQVTETVMVQKAGGAMAPTEAPAMMAEAAAPGAPPAAAMQPIMVRADFNPLAVFSPTVRTDDNGKAKVAVKLPDNLTRYRVMVVAVDQGKQFGMAEGNLVARLPLMVRPSAPRFLNFGDRFELPVVLQNQTGEPMEVEVVARADNLELTSGSGMRVTVPAHDRIEVRFPATTVKAGTATVQIAAVAGNYADAATVSLPVYTPATSEAFAVYGVVDEEAVIQPVASPSGVFPQYGGLEITTSSTALQALTDAVLYLVAYPYECSEQLASRILGVAALRDVLTAFQAEGLPAPAELEAVVERDIERLRGMQNDDGGFPYWFKGEDSIPFNTIHVAHALARARSKDFAVPDEMEQRALEYLRQIESHYPEWYGQQTRWTLSSYALYVRNLSGDRDPQKALNLLDEAGLENLNLEAIGWLWPVIEDAPGASGKLEEIRRYVDNRAVETAGVANFTTQYDDQAYLLLGSDRRTDAILLDALIGDNPQHDLIPKLVNGLLAHRTRGRWGNTQENVFVLLALDRYFNTFEAQTPEFVARLWLGEAYVGEHAFSGRTTERIETNIPMAYLTDMLGGGDTQDLILSKEGAGRLYYRLGLRYAPTNLALDPLDMGFVVTRSYEALDNPADVSQDAQGVWHIKAGARVRVRLTMVADNRRYHVALSDPLPAGLEIVNPALAVSGSLPQDPNSSDYRKGWWWWGTWYEHQNLRDQRAEAFASLLWDGVYDYTYIVRAATPGRFIVPPAKAEEMYSPEVFGRSSSDVVIVE